MNSRRLARMMAKSASRTQVNPNRPTATAIAPNTTVITELVIESNRFCFAQSVGESLAW